MRTRHFYLCLLLLVLGAANVWADKYYMPENYLSVANPRYERLADMVGKKFMIYNTALNNGQDRTGFLYDSGTKLALNKTKERDRFVYNERFVFTLEEIDADESGEMMYAIKSVTSDTYVDINGASTHTSPAPLYIKDWNAAGTAKWSRSGVNSENDDYVVVSNGSINYPADRVFLVKNGSTYWNGNTEAFATYTDGHPYAFYPANEVVDGAYLQDLHIFSRCDIYSAQDIWGYVHLPEHITTGVTGDDAPNTALLMDGDASTGISATNNYIQFFLGDEGAQEIIIYMQRAHDNVPASVKIQACNDGASFADVVASHETGLGNKMTATHEMNLGAEYKYIRIVNTTANATALDLSEAYILPKDKAEDAVGFFNAIESGSSYVYSYASVDQYTAQINEYNDLYANTKILSGVPLPGNKYLIWADTYDNGTSAYVKSEIALEGGAAVIKQQGTYTVTEGDARKAYEWYCEQTTDGKLVFRNVADPTMYLANKGEVVSEPYKWSIKTVETCRFGVPLKDGYGEYLAVANDRSEWVPKVTTAQDQKATAGTGYAYQTAGADTPDDDSDDVYNTIAAGICTDFLFVPVESQGSEKKITFDANEIVKRNIVFTYRGEVYNLPFSKTFVEGDEMPVITITCPVRHPYQGVVVGKSSDVDDTGKATYDANTQQVTFNLANMKDGDMLNIKCNIKEPFKYGSSNLYFIRNLRKQATSMQAQGMQKSSIDIGGGGDGPIQIPTVGSKIYYAKFATRDSNIELVESGETGETVTDYTGFDAKSLFYFEHTEDLSTDENYSTYIKNVTTTMKCAAPNKWDNVGKVWHVQPNNVGTQSGYAISITQLTAKNDPWDVWCSNHDDGDKITTCNAEDAGALWDFVPVDAENAKTMLKEFIASVATEITTEQIPGMEGIDAEKADKYTAYIENLNTTAQASGDVVALVAIAQEIHMLEHEVEYALQPLPEFTDREQVGVAPNDHPNWYYLYNVKGSAQSTDNPNGDKYYAKYTSKEGLMALDKCGDNKTLAHMFYFEGAKVAETMDNVNTIPGNNITFDDYLQVDIHNYMEPGYTIVSKNDEIFSSANGGIVTPGAGQQTLDVGELKLTKDQNWRIEFEYKLDGTSFNAYGTTLLASCDPALTSYNKEFQIYFRADRSVVVKCNNDNDRYRFTHTIDAFSYIKCVITNTPQSTTFTIYNALGEAQEQVITRANLNTVTTLHTMLPATGAKITILGIEYVKEMNWKEQDTTGDVADQDDTWYILPSSNTAYPGLAIVAEGANDENNGWANQNGSNTNIFTDIGTNDNSTWQFVKVVEFDDHVNELLEKYNTDGCVIYNEQLATLYRLIKKNSSFIKTLTGGALSSEGRSEEAYFNEIYDAVKKYTGPMPNELKAPKPGKFYTVRPAYEQSSTQLFVNEYNCIVQKDKSINDAGEYNSRGVWYFQGNEAGDGFYELNGISFKSLHTQSYTDKFAGDKALLNDGDATAVTLNPIGGCMVRFQGTDNNYLRSKAVGDSVMIGYATAMSYGYASTTFNRTGTDAASVTTTTFNEFNEVLWDNESMTESNVTVESNYAFKETKGNGCNSNILCPEVNANSGNIDAGTNGIVLTLTYSNLPSSFTSFNNIGLHIHALNNGGNYQSSSDNKNRKYTVTIEAGKADDLESFGTLNDVDIAAGVSGGNKVWNVVNNNGAVEIEDNSLVVKLTIHSNADNEGCFFGLSNVILSAEGDTWYIEEMPDEDKTTIYHKTNTNSVGLSSIMLGYDAKIPEGVKLYYPTTNNDLSDKHITMRSYDGTIAACTPAVMYADEGKEGAFFKFYYSTEEPDDDSDKATPAGDQIIIDGSLYCKIVEVSPVDGVSPYEEAMGVTESKVFMYVTNKTGKKLYWVYENYNADGSKTGNNDDGRHIRTNANRAFLVIGNGAAGKASSLSLRFEGDITTGIEDIDDDYRHESAGDAVKGIFDLQGRRLSEITTPGIYIVDGNKVVVK